MTTPVRNGAVTGQKGPVPGGPWGTQLLIHPKVPISDPHMTVAEIYILCELCVLGVVGVCGVGSFLL